VIRITPRSVNLLQGGGNRILAGAAVMNAVSELKSPSQNRLEGFALTAVFQGLPTYAGAVLLLKVAGAHEIVGDRGGAAIFVVLASMLHALLMPLLWRKFPNRFRYSHERLFYDARLPFSEKIAQWRVQPMVSLQLVAWMIMMSVLAVGAASIG
jgi:hypothetical protein